MITENPLDKNPLAAWKIIAAKVSEVSAGNAKVSGRSCKLKWEEICRNISFVECPPQTSMEAGNLYQPVHIEGTYAPLG